MPLIRKSMLLIAGVATRKQLISLGDEAQADRKANEVEKLSGSAK